MLRLDYHLQCRSDTLKINWGRPVYFLLFKTTLNQFLEVTLRIIYVFLSVCEKVKMEKKKRRVGTGLNAFERMTFFCLSCWLSTSPRGGKYYGLGSW